VGLGYLFPASAGRESFFNLAFRTLAPVLVPRLPAEERGRALAGMWNLAENLERAPVWLARIFYRAAWSWRSLASLEGMVAEVARLALDEPSERLGESARTLWVNLGDEDRRFLPGPAHFVAPTVLCVHDRSRAAISLGVWIVDEPLSLGPMGCAASPAAEVVGWWKAIALDARFDEPHGGWRTRGARRRPWSRRRWSSSGCPEEGGAHGAGVGGDEAAAVAGEDGAKAVAVSRSSERCCSGHEYQQTLREATRPRPSSHRGGRR
jgi:hypothetical protein